MISISHSNPQFFVHVQIFYYPKLNIGVYPSLDQYSRSLGDINSHGNVILMSVISLCHQTVTWHNSRQMPTHHTQWTWFTHIPSSPHPTCTFITHFTIQFQFNKKWCSCTLNYSGFWFCINQLNIEHTEALTILHPL